MKKLLVYHTIRAMNAHWTSHCPRYRGILSDKFQEKSAVIEESRGFLLPSWGHYFPLLFNGLFTSSSICLSMIGNLKSFSAHQCFLWSPPSESRGAVLFWMCLVQATGFLKQMPAVPSSKDCNSMWSILNWSHKRSPPLYTYPGNNSLPNPLRTRQSDF